MKDLYVVLREKTAQIAQVKRDIAVLRPAIPLLMDEVPETAADKWPELFTKVR